MPDKSEEYRNHAIYCRQMADAANSEVAKANWLQLAEKWLAMDRDTRHYDVLSAMLEKIGLESRNSR